MSRHFYSGQGTIQGNGWALRDGQRLASVRYSITTLRDNMRTQTFGGSSDLQGQAERFGTVTPVEGQILPVGEMLTLQLEDGRLLDFFVSQDNLSSTYDIRCTGEIRAE